MKIYVAAKFEEKEKVRAAYRALVEAGHTVTFDWTHEDDSSLRRAGLESALFAYQRECARKDQAGVLTCDVLVLLMSELPSAGRWVELGLALGAGKPVLAVGKGRDCIFLRLPQVFMLPDIKHALAALEAFAAGVVPVDGLVA